MLGYVMLAVDLTAITLRLPLRLHRPAHTLAASTRAARRDLSEYMDAAYRHLIYTLSSGFLNFFLLNFRQGKGEILGMGIAKWSHGGAG